MKNERPIIIPVLDGIILVGLTLSILLGFALYNAPEKVVGKDCLGETHEKID